MSLVGLLLALGGSAHADDAVGLVTDTYYYAHRVAFNQKEIVEDQLPVLVGHAGVLFTLAGGANRTANDTMNNGTRAIHDLPLALQGMAGDAQGEANATGREASSLTEQERAWLQDAEDGLRGRVYATEHYAIGVYHATMSRV
jgi:hypothetical protein